MSVWQNWQAAFLKQARSDWEAYQKTTEFESKTTKTTGFEKIATASAFQKTFAAGPRNRVVGSGFGKEQPQSRIPMGRSFRKCFGANRVFVSIDETTSEDSARHSIAQTYRNFCREVRGAFHVRRRFSRPRFQQRLRLLQICRVKSFGEPIVDFRQQLPRFGGFVLLLPQATAAHGRA